MGAFFLKSKLPGGVGSQAGGAAASSAWPPTAMPTWPTMSRSISTRVTAPFQSRFSARISCAWRFRIWAPSPRSDAHRAFVANQSSKLITSIPGPLCGRLASKIAESPGCL